MNIQSEKDLTTFDVESTGVDPAIDRIIQIGIIREGGLGPIPGMETKPLHFKTLVNPERPISPRITEITGITDAMVKGAPTFRQISKRVHEHLTGCMLIGYNLLNFDIPIIFEELNRCGIVWEVDLKLVIDAGNIYKKMDPRTLEAAVRKYCGREQENGHDALEDTFDTQEVLLGQIRQHKELQGLDAMALAAFSKMDELEGEPVERVDLAGLIVRTADGIARYTHKKVRGVAMQDDPGYGGWMLRSDFTQNTKNAILAEFLRLNIS